MVAQANILKRMFADEPEKDVGERTWRDMRILWHSVAPFINSGYGKVTRYFMQGLLNRGFIAFVSAYWGIQPGGFVNWNDIIILPTMKTSLDPLGFQSAVEHYKRFKCDLAIYHSDFWVSKPFTKKIPYTLCYSPIDHEGYPERWLSILRSYTWVAVPSQHAKEELKKAGIEATFVPHGVNVDIYRPMDKKSCREKFKVPEDKFVIGIVAANTDEEPRKGWDANFLAIKYFLEQNPDAKKDILVLVHTDPTNEKGRNLFELAIQTGIMKYILWDDTYTSALLTLPEDMMAMEYNCFDVFFLLSRREGFCLPALEAQACGVPCILNDFSALRERNNYGACGWLVKPATLAYSPLGAITSIPDPHAGADALSEAYNNNSKREYYAKRSLEYAKRQTWNIAIDQYFMPLLEQIAEEIPSLSTRKEARKIAGN